ncbi:MAG: PKD domain-containing protein [Candidatus Thermoplasmatota archaeon]|jgi:PKD repeat protein|nr:PKD domain-containing protein [Candidatus Thermoplasmatota archaeon]
MKKHILGKMLVLGLIILILGMAFAQTIVVGFSIKKQLIKDANGINEKFEDKIERNEPPVADFVYEPTDIEPGLTVYFNSTSYDPDGYLTNWTWEFSEGYIKYGEHVTHQYASNGTYTVTLTVRDNESLNASIQKTIYVGNQIPIADFVFTPTNPTTNQDVYFTDTSIDVDGTIVSWWWNFGDGYYSDLQNSIHRYYQEGTFLVSLSVTDNEGAANTTSKTVIVNLQNDPPYPPTVIYPPDGAIDIDINVTLNWTCDDPDGDPLVYDVYFGNTSPPSKVVDKQTNTTWVPETLEIDTTYYWQIVAWDDNNHSTAGPIWSFTTLGPNEPPYAPFISGPTWIVNGSEYSFIVQSYDPDGDDVRYIVNWGDGTEDNITEFVMHNIPFTIKHTWNIPTPLMILRITATAEDVHGMMSEPTYKWVIVSWFQNVQVNSQVNSNQNLFIKKLVNQQNVR